MRGPWGEVRGLQQQRGKCHSPQASRAEVTEGQGRAGHGLTSTPSSQDPAVVYESQGNADHWAELQEPEGTRSDPWSEPDKDSQPRLAWEWEHQAQGRQHSQCCWGCTSSGPDLGHLHPLSEKQGPRTHVGRQQRPWGFRREERFNEPLA